MTVARGVADVLAEHVTLEVECIDRMYLNVYQPRLQHVNGAVWFFRGHRGATFASSALMDPISKGFVASIHRFCRDTGAPLVDFAKGQRKDDLAHDSLAEFHVAGRTEGVLFVGRAQETTPSCASTATSGPNARPPKPGSPSPRWTTASRPARTPGGCRGSATG